MAQSPAPISVLLQKPGDDQNRFRSEQLGIKLHQGSKAVDLKVELARVKEFGIQRVTEAELKIHGQSESLKNDDLLQQDSIIEVALVLFS
jgi:hypothetical protein